MARYYIYTNGQEYGPMEPSQLMQYNLGPDSDVREERSAVWEKASAITELQAFLNPNKNASYGPAGNHGGYNNNQCGYNQGGYNNNQGGYNQGGYNNQGGYQQGGYQQGGYNQGGYNQGGYNQGYNNQGGYYPPQQQFGGQPQATCDKDHTVCGILALLLGGLGIQYFYLGKTGAGLMCILLSIVTCGIWEIVTFIQGIMILIMQQPEFERKYVYSQSWFPLF